MAAWRTAASGRSCGLAKRSVASSTAPIYTVAPFSAMRRRHGVVGPPGGRTQLDEGRDTRRWRRHSACRGDGDQAEADGRNRHAADPLAHLAHVRSLRARALRHRAWLQGRSHQEVHGRLLQPREQLARQAPRRFGRRARWRSSELDGRPRRHRPRNPHGWSDQTPRALSRRRPGWGDSRYSECGSVGALPTTT